MPAKRKVRKLTPSEVIQRDLTQRAKDRRFQARIFEQVMEFNQERFGLKGKAEKIRPNDIEMFWFKKRGKSPTIATEGFGVGMCWPRKRKTGEYMEIHSHSRNSAIPSVGDLQSWVKTAARSKKIDPGIAITSRGRHVGYTFVKIRDRQKAKPVLKYDKKRKLSVEEIKALGIQIKFVPVQGYQFNGKTNKFTKKRNENQVSKRAS